MSKRGTKFIINNENINYYNRQDNASTIRKIVRELYGQEYQGDSLPDGTQIYDDGISFFLVDVSSDEVYQAIMEESLSIKLPMDILHIHLMVTPFDNRTLIRVS